jgi:hypothetical protein
MRKLTLLFAGLIVSAQIVAQTQTCRDTYMFCDRQNKEWQLNNQSTSGVITKGESHELSIMVYKDIDYRLAFCSDNPELEGKIQFQVFERVTKMEKVYDPKQKKDIYKKMQAEEMILDNANLEGQPQDVDFTSSATRRLYIRVILPEGETGQGKKSLKVADYACVGILVQHQRGVKIGFN